jgi:hypothetical protein
VSPLPGHSHAAGRGGSPTLFTNLGPVRHTSLELQSKKLFSLFVIVIATVQIPKRDTGILSAEGLTESTWHV